LARKNADLIYLNDVSHGKIFGSSETSGTILDKGGIVEEVENVSKNFLAHALINHAITKLDKLG
jgi:phosphopantothenoylcysteine synthetase/decarboxylase